MNGPPGPIAEPLAQQARDDEREEEVERDRAEPEPQWPVGADERNEHVDEGDRRETVGDGGDDVHRHERGREERDILVQRREHESRPARAREANDLTDSEGQARREQDEADDTGAAREVPTAPASSLLTRHTPG